MRSEQELVKDCLKNSLDAQKELYKRYASKMFGVCLRYVKNKMEAEDVLQEGFIKVFQKLGDFRMEGSLEGWVRRIMVNTSINAFKKNSHYMAEVELENLGDYEIREDEAISKMSRDEILRLVQELPEGKKMVFNLYIFEGYSHKEIGTILDIDENTSKAQLCKAKKILQEKILKIQNKEYEKHPTI